MSRFFAASVIAFAALVSLAATCSPNLPTASEISQERAIAVAQTQVTFEVDSVEAERATDGGRQVWRVTFRGKPASSDLPELRSIMIVLIDRRTGEVMSLAKS